MKSRLRPGNRLSLPNELWEATRSQLMEEVVIPAFRMPESAALGWAMEHVLETELLRGVR